MRLFALGVFCFALSHTAQSGVVRVGNFELSKNRVVGNNWDVQPDVIKGPGGFEWHKSAETPTPPLLTPDVNKFVWCPKCFLTELYGNPIWKFNDLDVAVKRKTSQQRDISGLSPLTQPNDIYYRTQMPMPSSFYSQSYWPYQNTYDQIPDFYGYPYEQQVWPSYYPQQPPPQQIGLYPFQNQQVWPNYYQQPPSYQQIGLNHRQNPSVPLIPHTVPLPLPNSATSQKTNLGNALLSPDELFSVVNQFSPTIESLQPLLKILIDLGKQSKERKHQKKENEQIILPSESGIPATRSEVVDNHATAPTESETAAVTPETVSEINENLGESQNNDAIAPPSESKTATTRNNELNALPEEDNQNEVLDENNLNGQQVENALPVEDEPNEILNENNLDGQQLETNAQSPDLENTENISKPNGLEEVAPPENKEANGRHGIDKNEDFVSNTGTIENPMQNLKFSTPHGDEVEFIFKNQNVLQSKKRNLNGGTTREVFRNNILIDRYVNKVRQQVDPVKSPVTSVSCEQVKGKFEDTIDFTNKFHRVYKDEACLLSQVTADTVHLKTVDKDSGDLYEEKYTLGPEGKLILQKINGQLQCEG